MALETQLLSVAADRPDPRLIEQAAAIIRAGGLVAFPTETVYGLGANAFDSGAIGRIFSAKGRPSSDPLIVHIASVDQLELIVLDPPEIARRLAGQFWPGPLTLVLRRHPQIAPNVSAGLDTVAVRIPDHPVALALLRAAGVPIAAPSANRFTRPSPTAAQHVLDDLRGKIDAVLDGGPTAIGLESTVLNLLGAAPAVLRPGGVPIEALRPLLPGLLFSPAYIDGGAAETAASSPGQLLRHYSPDAEVLLFTGQLDRVLARMRTVAGDLARQGRRVGILAPDQEQSLFEGTGALVASLGSGAEMAQVGARLFAGMRELEEQGVSVILVRAFERAGLGLAIWDRLIRATEGRVVSVDSASDDPA